MRRRHQLRQVRINEDELFETLQSNGNSFKQTNGKRSMSFRRNLAADGASAGHSAAPAGRAGGVPREAPATMKPMRSPPYLPLQGRGIAYDKINALFAIAPEAHHRRTFPGRNAARSPCGVVRCRPGIVPGSESGLSRFSRGHDVERSRISGAPLRKSCALHRVREKHNGLDPHQAKKVICDSPPPCRGREKKCDQPPRITS
jgi:hypothetical protein